MLKYIQNISIFIFLYIPPLIFFISCSIRRGINRILLFGISIIYLSLSGFTQNLLPFILVLFGIRYIRTTKNVMLNEEHVSYDNLASDYMHYGFNIRSFKLIKAVEYSAKTYSLTIIINIIIMLVLSASHVSLREQEIVTELLNVPLNKFIYMIPILIIFAPIVEEFTFRWLLFEKFFRPKIGLYWSAIITSLMFALVHFNLRAFPILLSIGLINCYLIDKKGYWYAVFNHFVFNMISTLAMLAQKIH